MAVLFLLLEVVVLAVILLLMKYKKEIWYIIYKRMGWLKEEESDENGR